MFLIPISLLMNTNAEMGTLSWPSFLYLSMNMAFYRVFSLVFFSSTTVALNRTVPISERASMNGLSVLGASITKGLGPLFAGFLVPTAVAVLGKYGSLMIFGTIGVLGCCVMASTFLFLHADDDKEVEHGVEGEEDETPTVELIDRIEMNS